MDSTSPPPPPPPPPPTERLRKLARDAGAPPDDVDDVAQQTHLIALENKEKIAASENPVAYTAQICRHEAWNQRRRAQSGQKLFSVFSDEEVPDRRFNPEDLAMARERTDVLWDFIDQLDETRRRVFVRHELEGWTLAEIAVAEGVAGSTVQSRLASARDTVEVLKTRWQAEQTRKGQSVFPCILMPFAGTVRRCRPGTLPRLGMQMAASAAVVLLAGSVLLDIHAPLALVSTRAESHEAAAVSAERTSPSASIDHDPPETRRHASGQVEPAGVVLVSGGRFEKRSAGPEADSKRDDAAHPHRVVAEKLIERAKAEGGPGTQAGNLRACRLVREHRERYPRGPLAAERDTLFRRLRCEEHQGAARSQ